MSGPGLASLNIANSGGNANTQTQWYRDAQDLVNRYGVNNFGDMWRTLQWNPWNYPDFNPQSAQWLSGQLANWQDNGDGGFGDLGSLGTYFGLGGLAGGMTGYGALTGNPGQGAALDAAGLAAGAGAAYALPAIGAGAGTAVAGADLAAGGATGAGLAGLTGADLAAGSAAPALVGGAGAAGLGAAAGGSAAAGGTSAAGGAAQGTLGGIAAGSGLDPAALAGADGAANIFGSGGSYLVPGAAGAAAGAGLPDWMRLAGAIAPAALGYFASQNQTDAYRDMANRYLSLGAPSRDRYEQSFQPGFSMANEPGYRDALDMTTRSTLNRLSPGGNPVGSPNAWEQTLTDVNSRFAYPALQDYRRLNAGAGGLASLTSAAPGADANAINASRGMYDSIGAGAANIFNPPQSLSDLLRGLRAY